MKKKTLVLTFSLLLTSLSFFAQQTTVQNKESSIAIPIAIAHEVPVYPGCNGEDQQSLKKCFNKKVQIHLATNFDPNLFGNSKTKLVNKKMFIQFIISDSGLVDNIKVSRAPNKDLEKEAVRVIGLLPKCEPGKVKGKKVNVKYVLPFTINKK